MGAGDERMALSEQASFTTRSAAMIPAAGARLGTRLGGRRVSPMLAGLLAFGVLVPLLVAWLSGSLSIPHNDDYDYRLVALGVYHTGQFLPIGWSVTGFMGQLGLVLPLLVVMGGSDLAFVVSGVIATIIAITVSFWLVRRLLPEGRAAAAVLLVVIFPGFLLNVATLMTDIPALAGEMTCLLLGLMAMERTGAARWRWLAASVVVGCYTFSIREFAIAAPLAVLVMAFVSDRPRRWGYAAIGAVVVIACVVIHVVVGALPGHFPIALNPPTPTTIEKTRQSFLTLALAVSPALVLAAGWWWRRWHRLDVAIGAVAGVLLFGDGLVALAGGTVRRSILGNLFEPEGALGAHILAGQRGLLFLSPSWEILNVLALLGGIVLLAVLGGILGAAIRGPLRRAPLTWVGSTGGVLTIFLVLYAIETTLYGLAVSPFDRYLWPLALPLAALLLHRPVGFDPVRVGTDPPAASASRRPGLPLIGAGLLGVLVASTSMALLLNANAFDGARWAMGEAAIQRGFAPETVDAGYEWVGMHSTGVGVPFQKPDQNEMWYDALWPNFQLCAMVSASPLSTPGFTLETINTAAYRPLLVLGRQRPLYLYRVADPRCP